MKRTSLLLNNKEGQSFLNVFTRKKVYEAMHGAHMMALLTLFWSHYI